MAIGDSVSEVLSGLGERLFQSLALFGVAIAIILGIGWFMWYRFYYRKKFDIKVIIKSERAEDNYGYIEDMAAIFNDRKTNSKYFRIRDQKVDLPVPPFNVLVKTNKGDLLEIWRKSEDEFVFLLPSRIIKNQIVRQDGQVINIAEREQKQVEGDIAYWNVKRKTMNKGMFDTEGIFMKLLPFLPQIAGAVVMMIMLYILMSHLPNILAQLTELIKEMRALRSGALVPA